ncbi:MAG TPA: hypothetical protein VMT56_03025 [Candidatus Bathyarchaeia archaeon]|nr:hypothetical protein [Candidatus Bathyarchaeia archaeon]
MSRLNPKTIVYTLLALVVLAALPSSLRYAWQHGGFYLFSDQFLRDLPKRLTGPGRFRFILQPIAAILIGFRAGKADAAAGRLPYIFSLFRSSGERLSLLKEAFGQLATLVGVAILLDCISQFLILRQVFPGAALVVGPVLIAIPYSISRALTNRWQQLRRH